MEDGRRLPGEQGVERHHCNQPVGKDAAACLVSHKRVRELLYVQKLHEGDMLSRKGKDFWHLDPLMMFVKLGGLAEVCLLFADFDLSFELSADVGEEVLQIESLDVVEVPKLSHERDQPTNAPHLFREATQDRKSVV